MKKLFLVLLCVFFMCSGFVACSNSDSKENKNDELAANKDLILGKWEANVDMTKMMEDILVSDESMGAFINVSDFKMKFLFTFKDNSMMKLEVDEDTLSESFDRFFAGMKEGMYEYFADTLKKNELDMTVEEFLEKSNLDLDQLVKDMSGAAMKAMKFDEMSYDCYYEIRYNRLYSYDAVGKRDDEEYIQFEFTDEDTLKFVNVNTSDEDNILKMITELKKVDK